METIFDWPGKTDGEGNERPHVAGVVVELVFPARAGMNPILTPNFGGIRRVPRPCGDEPSPQGSL